MKIHSHLLLLTALLGAGSLSGYAKHFEVTSPNGQLCASIDDAPGGGITLSLQRCGAALLAPSAIGLEVQGKEQGQIKSGKRLMRQVEATAAPFYRQSEISVEYNALTITLTNGTSVEVRAFDEGVAYRFASQIKGEYAIVDETASYQLPADAMAWLPYSTNDKKPMAMAFQNFYDQTMLSHAQDKLAFLPATVDCGQGVKLTITESDLRSYPGMYLKADTVALSLNAEFAPYPAATDVYPWRQQVYVTEAEPYIARCSGARTFPWRVIAVTANDCEMPVNNLVYALAEPSRVADTSWIKPGKVAWDWWNDWGLYGVDFKAGINMDTYKYYIDFASKHGIEYIILDEGWYDPKSGDMLTVVPEIDLPALVKYGQERGVGIVLWTVFNVLDSQLTEACSRYAAMGIKGFKVDFLDRDDQTALEMTYRICQACADHKLLLDLHGYFKPTGLNRTYPNVLNFEAVFGMEEMKWSPQSVDMPLYDVTFPYIRLLAGPVDYTPGAMRNATKADWKAIYYNPMSQGTRCHQLATYIVYDSPFTMLADSPSNYEGEDQCVDFIVAVPNTIDETRVLDGKMGQYIVTARRNGDDWWVGGLTNWDARDLELPLSFLPEGSYQLTIFTDGPNAEKQAMDYKLATESADRSKTLRLHMASGGGFALRLSRK